MGTSGRAHELQRLHAHVLERRAVLVIGPVGAGRSHLLHALGPELTEAGIDHQLVRGADGEAGVPLVAFAPLLARLGSEAAAAAPLDVYTRLPGQVRAAGLAVLVDDLKDHQTALQSATMKTALQAARIQALESEMEQMRQDAQWWRWFHAKYHNSTFFGHIEREYAASRAQAELSGEGSGDALAAA